MTLTSEALFEFLESEFGLARDGLDDESLLFSTNILDSFSMVSVIAFVEKNTGVRFKAWEVNLDNLDSVDRILRYVEKMRASRPSRRVTQDERI